MKNVLLKKVLPIVISVAVLISCCVIPVAADYVQGPIYDGVTDGDVSYPSLNNVTWMVGEVYDYGQFAYDQWNGANVEVVNINGVSGVKYDIEMIRGVGAGSLVYVQMLLDFDLSSAYGLQFEFSIGVLDYSWLSYQGADSSKYSDSCKAYFYDKESDDFVIHTSREQVYEKWTGNKALSGYHYVSPTYMGDGKVMVSGVFQRHDKLDATDIHIYLWDLSVEYITPPELPRYENPSNGVIGQVTEDLSSKEDKLFASISTGSSEASSIFKSFELSTFHDGLLCMVTLFDKITLASQWYIPLLQISLALGLFSFIVGVSSIAVKVHSSRSRRDNYSKSYDAGYRKGRGDYLNSRRRN